MRVGLPPQHRHDTVDELIHLLITIHKPAGQALAGRRVAAESENAFRDLAAAEDRRRLIPVPDGLDAGTTGCPFSCRTFPAGGEAGRRAGGPTAPRSGTFS
ncbi:hypothetical protein HOK021_35340 [Streptomyces hygroscopicus]|nr:hypothetical protein HOK021_35340 [Streptomyces hygroscopicus]